MDVTARPTHRRTPRGGPRALTLALLACALAGSLAAAGTVYKWSDPQGTIHYSDLPPPPEGTLISVDNRLEQPRAAPPAPQPVAAASAPTAPPDPALKKAVDSDVANAHADDCKQAQDRYQNYVRSRRLYKEGPNRERVYLNDAEIETERVNAKREVDEVCASSAQR